MKPAAAIVLVLGAVVWGCAPYPVYVSEAPVPLAAAPEPREECSLIRSEIARQQRVADLSGVMETALVEASVRLNAANVIAGLETRAAIEGCRI
jgi:hypothetical protein